MAARTIPAPVFSISLLFPKAASACGDFPFLYISPGNKASRPGARFISLLFYQNDGQVSGYFSTPPKLSGFFLFYFNNKAAPLAHRATGSLKSEGQVQNSAIIAPLSTGNTGFLPPFPFGGRPDAL